MIFRKGGRLSDNISVKNKDKKLYTVNRFLYLGIVFTAGGSFSHTQSTLAVQALKAIFKFNKYLYKFTAISVKIN